MAYREFPPDARLRGLVRTYWQVEDYHDVDQQEHLFMPERTVRVTFYAGASFQTFERGATPQRMPDATLYGLSLAPQRVVSVGLTRALGAELYPWGARQLLDWDAGEREIDLSVRFPQVSAEICALLALNDWTGARERLDAWLLSRWTLGAREPGKAVHAAAQLYLSLGTARIGTLADELNVSPRQLERQFVQQVGVNAKTLARLIRFEEVHNRLWGHPDQLLTDLAYDLGFADQAHLTREFRALSSMTPGAFARMTARRRGERGPEAEWTIPDPTGTFSDLMDLGGPASTRLTG
ncbi:AraC-like DNA-binding protein [Deinococcus metalli]|uniref:AraC-like DNA-binding protein n=1 Tax=Deinococcus metalli TaxID=1141878 RepID=A0A7W8KHR3_9DEIO|nr:helix-turn-helix domain-containing protein [Deinococcus metalli]MBB5378402.1 AraC-like DNA-binding protein [Deinococcus metalli]GHF59207.1 hypothetical protein GCM10017781_39300 [Deinococcus metalli]